MFIPASALLAMHSIYIGQLMRPAAAPLIVHMAICLGGVVIICDYLHPAICLGGDLPEHELYILISATMGQWRECLICFLRAFIFFSFFSIWLGVRAQFLSCHCSFSMHVWSSFTAFSGIHHLSLLLCHMLIKSRLFQISCQNHSLLFKRLEGIYITKQYILVDESNKYKLHLWLNVLMPC